jgi:hypothetical protein
MIAGHFGLAAAVKSRARTVPLWALMLATQWLDVVFVPLLAGGAERIDPSGGPGAPEGYGQVIIHADYTHSLVGAVALSALFGLAFAIPWGRRAGAVLGGVVFSHWLLDLPMHRADMPILPGGVGDLPRLGFGLWRLPVASAVLELALVVVGALLYARAATQVAALEGPAAVRKARIAAGAILASGLLVLVLNLLGV